MFLSKIISTQCEVLVSMEILFLLLIYRFIRYGKKGAGQKLGFYNHDSKSCQVKQEKVRLRMLFKMQQAQELSWSLTCAQASQLTGAIWRGGGLHSKHRRICAQDLACPTYFEMQAKVHFTHDFSFLKKPFFRKQLFQFSHISPSKK